MRQKSRADEELISMAEKARRKAYSPYSNVKIGAAVLTEDGRVFTGCNIENSSFGLSNCAERTAIFKAVSEGHRKIKAIAVVGESEDYAKPCGACRQVLAQFNPKMRVIMITPDGYHSECVLEELLPNAFNPGSPSGK